MGQQSNEELELAEPDEPTHLDEVPAGKSSDLPIEERERIRKEKHAQRIYQVEGYRDNVNMWEKLVNVEK